MNMASYVMSGEDIVKTYGSHRALNHLTLHVPESSITAILGPNGAGKSTTMKILAGLLEQSSGNVTVFGLDVQRSGEEVRGIIGYVPQSITLYEKLSAIENLKFFGEMYGIRGVVLKQRMGEVLDQVGLADRAKDKITTFSGGMKRRINIAVALLHRPKLLIMDEPTVGIDPQSRNHIFEMIRKLRDEGITILYSTYYMEDVEALCNDLAIIDHGQLIAQGALDEVLNRNGSQTVYLETAGRQISPQLPGLTAAQSGRGWVFESTAVMDTIAQLANYCQQNNFVVKRLEVVRPSLETVFLV